MMQGLSTISRDDLLALIPRLRRFAYALTGTRHDGDDLVQATVERLLQRGAPADAHLGKWAHRICRNLWIDEVRSQKVRSAAPPEDVHPGAMSEDGERVVMTRITLSEVNLAMQSLPQDQRAALALVAVDGCSYAEAAEILEVPVGTIMSRVSRARRALADTMTPRGRPS